MTAPEPNVFLWWLPVGAGGRVVVRTSGWWESVSARREHRRPRQLFHSALEVRVGETNHVIEMAPAWGVPPGERGVVATGSVGLANLGWCPLFRYEVRCWAGGMIPDREWAVDGPVAWSVGEEVASALVRMVGDVPRFTWGRDALGVGDMWNSNSLIAWLLERSGIDAASVHPPGGGGAPGWRAGVAAAKAPGGR
ncbi:hypothetical protein IA539_05530 [Gordonia sp. zg691]|uniref:Uncharacterized protein n=1 Tax=Gordonia jinghuaiqii TaxID=2758710 RepID=A0A7D7QX11_9ACTN|nr:hypothetical protein [Gordonia jinghuaiqii]MBD0860667.1 hypothetical protein [Gordonia jinghuaiqii]MCR5978067.1 hypothetical protein [Gordonia jinghuaiqii]QMT01469.1 hypothetical protein H1R19_22085 [Gordonia jinghuaiqii]